MRNSAVKHIIPLNPGCRNPVNILNALHPGIKYQLLNECGQCHNKMFSIRIKLDGQMFERIANKKNKPERKQQRLPCLKYIYRYSSTRLQQPFYLTKGTCFWIMIPAD